MVFAEPDAEKMLAEIKGCALVAPGLLPFEVASVCLKKIRRHPQQRKLLLDAYELTKAVDIELVDVDLTAVVALAEKSTLTLYDATYLWLAQTLKVKLVTLDKRLARAASKIL